jgi:hypothetical protein
MKNRVNLINIVFIILIINPSQVDNLAKEFSGIEHYSKNKAYWQYKNNPVLLLGGSSEDNLFQLSDLEKELDIIKNCGGNYVRNTMSSRDPGNVWAFGRDRNTGKYDLEIWNEEYWRLFEHFLKLTNEKEIIVQIEIWATFDFYRDNWDINPFNPKNNINYSAERTNLKTEISTHPVFCDNRFFWSVPSQDNNMPLLEYQQKFIDKMLSYSLKFDHILYCIDNETSVTASWGEFWSEYIRKVAREYGTKIHVTEMWDPHNLNHISHRETVDNPEIYSFIDISQNNHQKGETHWKNGLKLLERVDTPDLKRPVNNVKTYGSDTGKHGHGSQNGKESFVRSIFFGSAASRFHRPNSGLGITGEAQNVIRSTRMITSEIDFFISKIGNDLMINREENEAYCRYVDRKEYIIFFPHGGDVDIQLPEGRYLIKWLRISNSKWESEKTIEVKNELELLAPENDMWFALIKRLK